MTDSNSPTIHPTALLGRNAVVEEGARIGADATLLLGVAYKGDIDDLRESPALKVWDELERKGAIVDYFDPCCPTAKRPGGIIHSVALDEKMLRAYDALVVTTAHKKGVDYDLVAKHAQLVLDTKNIFDGEKRPNIISL